MREERKLCQYASRTGALNLVYPAAYACPGGRLFLHSRLDDTRVAGGKEGFFLGGGGCKTYPSFFTT
jgi:hypothetical protein